MREQIIFPEIDYDAIDQVRGLDVTITTSAETDDEACELLRLLGMPFRSEDARPDRGRDAPAAAARQTRSARPSSRPPPQLEGRARRDGGSRRSRAGEEPPAESAAAEATGAAENE